MDGFNVVVPVSITFRDIDAMGHANNAVYLTWFECGRVGYWKAMNGADADYADIPIILARTEIDFRAPAHAGDRLEIGARVTRLGRSSFDMAYRIERVGDREVMAEGNSVQVVYDYAARTSMPMPADFRAAIERIDGAALAAT